MRSSITLHSGHQGIYKCKERARCSVWWPDIEEYIKRCRVCCQFQWPWFEPLHLSELPDTPWHKVGTDLFEWKQLTYLLAVDYYSRFIEIAKLYSITSRGVIKHLKSILARHGIPQTVVSDNRPQYSSSEFAQFAKSINLTILPIAHIFHKQMENLKELFKWWKDYLNDPMTYI